MAKREPHFILDANDSLIGFPSWHVVREGANSYGLRRGLSLRAIIYYHYDHISCTFGSELDPHDREAILTFWKQAGCSINQERIGKEFTSFKEDYWDGLEPGQTLNDVF